MLVATFGTTTEWSGKTITYEAGQFTLEGYGVVTPDAVMEYDRQGHLLWAYDGLREWVAELGTGEPDNAPNTPVGPADSTVVAGPAPRSHRGLKVAGLVIGAIVGLIIVLAVIGAMIDGGSSTEGAVATSTPPNPASSSLQGWWVEASSVEETGYAPSVFYAEASDGGEYAVSLDNGQTEGIDLGTEEFVLASTESGVYETTDSDDYTLEMTGDDSFDLTYNGGDDPFTLTFARATEAEAGAALIAGESSGGGAGTNTDAGLSSGEYKDKCRKIRFKVLEKEADSLTGRRYTFTGQVFQIQDAGKGSYWTEFEDAGYDLQPQTQVLLSVTNEGYGYWSDEIMVLYDDKMKRVYEEDVVQVWGECLGTYTYESVAGYSMTVPLIHAKYYDRK